MFEKFKSVNPMPTIKIDMNFKEFKKEDTLNAIEENLNESKIGASVVNNNVNIFISQYLSMIFLE